MTRKTIPEVESCRFFFVPWKAAVKLRKDSSIVVLGLAAVGQLNPDEAGRADDILHELKRIELVEVTRGELDPLARNCRSRRGRGGG
jgi:hypothetical protein